MKIGRAYLSGIFLFLAISAKQPDFAFAEEHRVGMTGWEFHPRELTIEAGDTVVWINDDDTRHNLYFDDETLGGPTEENPLMIEVGEKFSLTFDKAGTYNYRCKIHRLQDMTGVIIVKETK